MAGVINFVASDYLENTTTLGTSQYTRQSSYSFSKDTFKKIWSRRYHPNRDTQMQINNVGGYTATTSPIQITTDGAKNTVGSGALRGQSIALEGVGGSIGTIKGISPDAELVLPGNLDSRDLILSSLSQDIPNDTKLYFSSDESIIYLQFDVEGDLVDRDNVYLIVDQRYDNVVLDQISKELTTGGYTTISPNSATGIGRHITYIGVTSGESSSLN